MSVYRLYQQLQEELANTSNVSPLEDIQKLRQQERLQRFMKSRGMPRMLLHTFACDCAERLLEAEERMRRESMDGLIWRALQVKREWIAGLVTQDDLVWARERADKFNSRSFWEYFGAMAAAAAAGLDPVAAADSASRMAFEHLHSIKAPPSRFANELRWQQHQLLNLLHHYLSTYTSLVTILSRYSTQKKEQHSWWEEQLEEGVF